MNAWGANHSVLCAGHVGQLLRSLAAQLGIAIGITNVDPNESFLPAQWGIYGDRTAANDSQIVRRLGPMYA
jgi:L-fucose isomerase